MNVDQKHPGRTKALEKFNDHQTDAARTRLIGPVLSGIAKIRNNEHCLAGSVFPCQPVNRGEVKQRPGIRKD
jgi:hypothetical protein